MARKFWVFASLVGFGAGNAYGCGTDTLGELNTSSDGGSADGQADGIGPLDDAESDADAFAFDDASDAAAVDAGPLSASYVDFDINHVLITGQSNSVSNGGQPVLSTSQPFSNLMFDTGPMSMKGSFGAPTGCGGGVNTGCCEGNEGCATFETPTSLVPLIEGDRFFGYAVETASAGTANGISYLAQQDYGFGARPGYPQKHVVLTTLHGRSGWTYQCMRKGSCNYKYGGARAGYVPPFTQAMQEVQNAKALALAAGKTYVVRAVTTIHGESDQDSYFHGTPEFPMAGTDGTPNKILDYADGLIEWQQDYEAGVKAITGQTVAVPLLVSQLSGQNSTRVAAVAQYELEAHKRGAGKVVLIGPSYHLSLSNADCLHFTSVGERRLGEYFAKVYARVVFGGQTWEPVRPKQITRTGSVITVKFFVPVPPLVVDTTHVTNPGNLGFDFVDGSGATPAITNVAITGPDTVQITLATTPVGPNMRLRYAQNQNPGTCVGPGIGFAGGARGNIRDSDATPSQAQDAKEVGGAPIPLWNWSVQFDEPLP